jgi:hypothetical protein
MEMILYAVFEAGANIDSLLVLLHSQGYNGTYLPSSSIHHLTSPSKEEEPSVISLSRALVGEKENNATLFLVLKEGQFEKVKKIIEDFTDSFHKIKGGIFAWPLSFFEGSF